MVQTGCARRAQLCRATLARRALLRSRQRQFVADAGRSDTAARRSARTAREFPVHYDTSRRSAHCTYFFMTTVTFVYFNYLLLHRSDKAF